MKITPLDIRQKRFATSLRGFERREVEAFLELVAAEFEEVVKENIGLKEELKRTNARLEQHVEKERTLQETMVTAQRISEDMRAAAKKEAEIVIAGAEQQAEKIVQNAHTRMVQLIEDINELKRQRVQFESQVRSVIDAHAKLLETFRESTSMDLERGRVEENVSFLTQRKVLSEP
ncbi:MAG: DivIVA domain-containing protein [Myxococcales bacterium]|nr:DivIVA domain-containing protein [Myxococcales bacterium]